MLFFPAAGLGYGATLNDAGGYGRYWSSTLNSDSAASAYCLYFISSTVYPGRSNERYYGFSVRPVSD